MVRRYSAKAVAALAVLALFGSVPALAQTSTRHFYTELYRFPEGGFPMSGTLDLNFHPSGSITGYYHPTDGGMRPVSGSISGEHIALSIGGLDGLDVNGTLKNGRIEGRAFRAFGRAVYDFIGRPIPNDHTLPREP